VTISHGGHGAGEVGKLGISSLKYPNWLLSSYILFGVSHIYIWEVLTSPAIIHSVTRVTAVTVTRGPPDSHGGHDDALAHLPPPSFLIITVTVASRRCARTYRALSDFQCICRFASMFQGCDSRRMIPIFSILSLLSHLSILPLILPPFPCSLSRCQLRWVSAFCLFVSPQTNLMLRRHNSFNC
jgi:hypothetical protein